MHEQIRRGDVVLPARWKALLRLPWSLWGAVLAARSRSSAGKRTFRKGNVGYGAYVDPSVQIFGWTGVTVGNFSALSEGAWLNANRRGAVQDRITIGNYCHIGRRNYFSTGGSIEIKDYSFSGLDCHFLGCGHDYGSPTRPYVATGLTAGSPIEVGVNCWLSTSVTVLQGVRIGRGCVVGARCVLKADVPPFSVVVGNPSRVIRRFDFKNNAWVNIERFSEELEGFIPSEAEYLEELRRSQGHLLPALHAASGRFGWLP